MKDKNLTNDYDTLSLEDLTVEAGKIIEKKFQNSSKNISEKTRENILKITSKKNAKKIK